jgi:hypothetical protein
MNEVTNPEKDAAKINAINGVAATAPSAPPAVPPISSTPTPRSRG